MYKISPSICHGVRSQSGSAVMSHLQLDTDNQLQLPLDPSLGMMGMMGMTSPPSGVNGGDASGFRNHSFSGGAAISSPHLIYHGEGPSFASPPSFNSGVNRSGSGSKLPQQMYGGGAMPMPTHHLGQYGGDLSHQQQMQHQIQMMRPPPLPGQGGNGGASAMAPPPTNVGGALIVLPVARQPGDSAFRRPYICCSQPRLFAWWRSKLQSVYTAFHTMSMSMPYPRHILITYDAVPSWLALPRSLD